MSRLECPGENTIVAFAEGTLRADVMADVEAHAGSCAHCQELLAAAMATGVVRRAVAGMSAGTETALGASLSPGALARLGQTRARPRGTRGWSAGAPGILAPAGRVDDRASVEQSPQGAGARLTGIGRALLALGRAREAVPTLERALRLRDPSHTDHELVAETQFALAQALDGSGSDQARAISLGTNALETYRRGTNAARAAAVQAWLDASHKRKHAR